MTGPQTGPQTGPTMKAMRFEWTGEPDVLDLAAVPEPHAGGSQVRIAVRAAGVNPVDWKIRNGSTRRSLPVQLPHIPGLEAAGVVDEVGADVTGVAVGDAVFGAGQATSAEFAVLDHWAPVPAGVSWEEAGGIALAAETAVRGLDHLGLRAGQTLLITGAAGGVGVAAVQLALARDATVVGTAGPDNQEFLTSLGASATTYGPGWVDRVRTLVPVVDRAMAVAGVDVVGELVALTGAPERVISIGDHTAAAHGVLFTDGSEGRAFHALAEVSALAAAGRFHMPIGGVWPLDQLAEAHRASETGHVRGKLIVTV